MAGYNWNAGKSNNAVEAEENGKLPLTKAVNVVAAAVGCTKKEARRACEAVGPCEWHHSSKMYNKVNYYDTAAVIKFIEATPMLDTLPVDWKERFEEPRKISGDARFAAIESSDAALALAWGVPVQILLAAYYGIWGAEE